MANVQIAGCNGSLTRQTYNYWMDSIGCVGGPFTITLTDVLVNTIQETVNFTLGSTSLGLDTPADGTVRFPDCE